MFESDPLRHMTRARLERAFVIRARVGLRTHEYKVGLYPEQSVYPLAMGFDEMWRRNFGHHASRAER